jgi:hypothetical protein
MMKGSEMRYTKIFATGALAKFLDVRDRGASHQELIRLKSAAEAEATPSRARQRDGAGPSLASKPPKTWGSDTSNVFEFIDRAKFDRARLEREWSSAPD